jgi:8-amino-3,8-dideoxy-alpha-D-manno-octulosonate transaminase
LTERLAIDGGAPVRTRPLNAGRGLAVFGDEERDAVLEVLASRSLFRYYGPRLLRKVAAFEAALSEALGVPHAVATSSGTAAIRVALASLGIGCGDEVIVPAFTFIATVNAVVVAGAVPVFAEIDESLGLDPSDVAAKITSRTRAIVAVHLENVGCDIDPLVETASSRGIAVIEDAAQSTGSTHRGRALGTIGDIGCFSLQLEKNLTSGEGGALVTANERLYLRATRYQDQGGQFATSHGGSRGGELDEPFAGENLRMTEIAGAIARVQLAKLPAVLDAMRRNKARILDELGHVDGLERRRVPDPGGDGSSSVTWFLPDAALAQRFVQALGKEGVPCLQMYDGKPIYATPSILARRTASGKGGPWNCAEHPTDVTYSMGMCPRTEALVARSATIGVGVRYTDEDCSDVARAVRKVARHLLG